MIVKTKKNSYQLDESVKSAYSAIKIYNMSVHDPESASFLALLLLMSRNTQLNIGMPKFAPTYECAEAVANIMLERDALESIKIAGDALIVVREFVLETIAGPLEQEKEQNS